MYCEKVVNGYTIYVYEFRTEMIKEQANYVSQFTSLFQKILNFKSLSFEAFFEPKLVQSRNKSGDGKKLRNASYFGIAR